MKRKKAKRIPLLLLSLVVLVWGVQVTAFAASSYYDPADYVDDVVINGDTKTVYYDFAGVPWLYWFYDNYTNASTFITGDSAVCLVRGATDSRCYCMPFGGAPSMGTITGGALDVSDIIPGSSIDFTTDFTVGLQWRGSDVAQATVSFTVLVYYYNADGVYIGLSDIAKDSVVYEDLTSVGYQSISRSLSGSIPVNAHYIIPYIVVTCAVPTEYANYGLNWHVSNCSFTMSVDINMIQEQSNLMQSVNDKLDDLGGKIDDTNVRLDQIITGSDADNAAADQFVDDMGTKTDKLDGLVSDMGSTNKPDVNNAVPDVDDVVDSDSVISLTNVVTPWFENEVFIAYLLVAVMLMFGSYVLFGKKA